MIKKTYLKDLLTYMIPLIVGISIILLIRHNIVTEFPFNMMIPKSILLLFIAISFYLIIKKQNYTLTISILATNMLIATIWMMSGTSITLGGIGGDNYFSTSIIATFMHTYNNEDYTFTGLSSFYPFYFHYLMAKLGYFFEWTPHKTFKYGAFLIVYVSPILTYIFWKKIYDDQESFLITLGTLFVYGIGMYLRKPFEVITLFLIVPWWIYYFSISEKTYKNAIIGGAIGGLFFGIYYYWFFPIVLSSLYLFIANHKNIIEEKTYKYYLVLGISLMIIASPYLYPYLSDLIFIGSEPYQNRWFTPEHLNFPLQKITEIKDFFFLIGLVYLITSRKKLVEKHLFILLTASYVWTFLGHLGIANDTPLLHTKVSDFINLILSISFVLAIYRTLIYFKADYDLKVISTFVVVIITVSPFFTNLSNHYNSKDLLTSKNFKPPHIVKDKKLINMLSGKTILASSRKIRQLNPYLYIRFFTEFNAHYAHPSSLTSQRLKFLNMLSKSKNQKFIKWILHNNKFSKIDYIWLEEKNFKVTHDNFPNLKPYKKIKIQFREDFFKSLNKVKGYKNLYQIPDTNTSINYADLDELDKNIYNKFFKNRFNE